MTYRVNIDNYKVVKEKRFMLWTAIDIELDLPIKESIANFGRETTYRYNTNITKEALVNLKSNINYGAVKLLLKNPNVNDSDIINVMGEDILPLFSSNWDIMFARVRSKDYAKYVIDNYELFKPSTANASKMNSAFKVILKHSPEKYESVLGHVFSCCQHTSIELLLQHISKYYNQTLLYSLPLNQERVKLLVEQNLFRYPNIGTMLLINGGKEYIEDKVKTVEEWMTLKDQLMLGVSLTGNTVLLNKNTHFTHLGIVANIPSEEEELVKLLDAPHLTRCSRIALFKPEARLELLTHILKTSVEELDDVFDCAISLLCLKIKPSEWLYEQMSDYAIDGNNVQAMWKLYLFEDTPETIKLKIKELL